MMRLLFVLLALSLAGVARAQSVEAVYQPATDIVGREQVFWHGSSGAPPTTPCSTYDGGGIDDGCDALYALGEIGLYTVNSQNSAATADGCNLTVNCFFKYARQTGQSEYNSAPSTPSNHPISFNQPGGDYGIGPWTATGSLTNAATFNWSTMAGGTCSDPNILTTGQIRCNFTAPNVVTAHITSGQLIIDSGSNPSVNQYVWYAANGSGLRVPPYKIISGSAGTYTLAAIPGGPALANVASQTMNTSTPMVISSFNFDDTYLYITLTGLAFINDNRFTMGTVQCWGLGGTGPINAGPSANSDIIVQSNYQGYDSTCSGSGDLWAGVGTPQATFNGTTSGFALTRNSGQVPVIGQYVNGAGFSTTTQIISGTDPNFTISNTEPSLTETMTTGPIQSKVTIFVAGGPSGGDTICEWNYIDKVSSTCLGNGLQVVTCKYNYIEDELPPIVHGDPCAYQEPGWTSGVTGATYTIAAQIQDANTMIFDARSIAGQQYGGPTGLYAEAGGTGNLVTFATSPSANTTGGYYIQYTLSEYKNNILIANGSTNNYTATPNTTNSAAINIATQGQGLTSPPGAYPPAINTTVMSGNFFDPTGSLYCTTINGYVYTTVGGSTTVLSTLTGTVGIDLLDGSNVVTSTICNGANNP